MTERAWTMALGLALVAYGCNSDVNVSRTTGESHFLDYCDASCGEGLDCISGVCTRGCLVAENDCGDLAAQASCTDQSGEPGEVAVCDVECSDDVDCESVNGGHRCEGGYCRGGEPPPSGALECSRGVVSWSYDDADSGFSCATCDCAATTACEPRSCEAGVPVYPCSDEDMDELPVEYQYAVTPHFLGDDVLELEIQVGGGCEAHHLSLCFEPAFRESNPVATTLRIRHEVPGEITCDALITETLRFDLGPLRRYYQNAYASETGVIATNYGQYGFGELSCEQRGAAALDQIERAVAATSKLCSVDADCELVSQLTACTIGTQVAVALQAAEGLGGEIARIGEALCDESCESPVGLPSPLAARCDEGACRAD